MGDPEVAAIVLAAGGSTRLGQPKQTVLLHGEPLLCRVIRMALEAGCSEAVAVLGAEEERCREALAGLPAGLRPKVRVVVNPRWREGMSTSLRAGLAALADGESLPGSAMVLVCDQVRLAAADLRELLRMHGTNGSPITASRYGGRLGVPAIFRSEAWPALTALSGDQGARKLIEAWGEQVGAADLPTAAYDLDTAEDLAALLRE